MKKLPILLAISLLALLAYRTKYASVSVISQAAPPPTATGTGAPSIQYVSDGRALDLQSKDGKPIWYHVTQTRNCAPCVVANRILANPLLVEASGDFHCVLIRDARADHPWMVFWGIHVTPTDLFVSLIPNKHALYEGIPAEGGTFGVASYLLRLHEAQEKTK